MGTRFDCIGSRAFFPVGELAIVVCDHSHFVTACPLPADLPNAIKQLGDQELDRLLAAVLAEQKRRGKKLRVSDENSRKRKMEAIAVPLTQGKLNAVRAAFKAGVTPSRIARQFGFSQSVVRKALVGDG